MLARRGKQGAAVAALGETVPTYAQISANFYAKIPGCNYFTWHEALYLPSYGRHATASEATSTILSNIVRQAKALDRVRAYFNSPINVTSWFRPPAYNTMIGGAPNSSHLRGLATDFNMTGYTADQVRNTLRANPSIYPGAGELLVSWVHLDLEHTTWFYP
jgi:zinc D-Ala-D-Ala carboxypeptidase